MVYLPIFYDFTKVVKNIKAISELTGNTYEMEDVVWYGNALQAAQYYLWGCKPIDLIVDDKTRHWIFAFSRNDHKKYIKRWNEQKAK